MKFKIFNLKIRNYVEDKIRNEIFKTDIMLNTVTESRINSLISNISLVLKKIILKEDVNLLDISLSNNDKKYIKDGTYSKKECQKFNKEQSAVLIKEYGLSVNDIF